ncbi:MAG: hypothetical protein C5B48_08425 [Candidatus Rokuibacteriota bacterium]|nr:MAG: hypothetical protein C5B48_08425 [Candidatus Rokubacteria bacterium]
MASTTHVHDEDLKDAPDGADGDGAVVGAVPNPPGSRVWLDDHGISQEVWDARPYVRYGPGNLEPVRQEYAGLPTESQRRFATMIANGGRNPWRDAHPESRDGGFLIMRHPPPGLALPKVYAEMRPDNAIATALPVWHYHGPKLGDRPVYPPEAGGKLAGKLLPRKHVHSEEWARSGHLDRDKYADDHKGNQADPRLGEVHCHQNIAKYCFTSSVWVDQTWCDLHSARFRDTDKGREARARHVLYDHGGVDTEAAHTHERRVKDKTDPIACRIDAHPWAAERLDAAERIYFGIEGCLKADAILTTILRTEAEAPDRLRAAMDNLIRQRQAGPDGDVLAAEETLAALIEETKPASVVSVPSVTLWHGDELELFTARYLQGKEVVIVCDADGWRPDKPNENVMMQSLLLRSFLRGQGVQALIAAPPFEPGELKGGKPLFNGVDDHLGEAGRPLGDLIVYGAEEPQGTADWVRTHPRPGKDDRADGVGRDIDVLAGLAVHASPAGRFSGTYDALAKVAKLYDWRSYKPRQEITLAELLSREDDWTPPSYKQVQNAITSLQERGAIRVDGSLEVRRNRWRQTDWVDPPTITILHDELKAIRPEQQTLGPEPAAARYQLIGRQVSVYIEEIEATMSTDTLVGRAFMKALSDIEDIKRDVAEIKRSQEQQLAAAARAEALELMVHGLPGNEPESHVSAAA